MILKTERLILKEPESSDTGAVVDYYFRNKDYLTPFEPIRPKNFYTTYYWENRIKDIQELSANDQHLCFLYLNHENKKRVIGVVNFSSIIRGAFQACYLGYSIDEKEQGKGKMTEGLKAAIDYMFKDKNIHRIMANCMTDNLASIKVLEKLGFEKEGTAKEYLHINGEWQDHIMTSLINPNWELK